MKLLMLIPLPFAFASCLAYTTPESYVPSQSSPEIRSDSSNRSARLRSSVKLPCRVAVVRLEKGRYSKKLELYNGKSIESPEHAAILGSLPGLAGVVSLNGVLIDRFALSYDELRRKARDLGADMLAVYRFESEQTTKTHSTLVSVATLGAAPIHSTKSVSSVSLILMDAKTGYTYGVLEEQASDKTLSTSWGSFDAEKSMIELSRKEALDKLMQKLPLFWSQATRSL